MTEFISLKYKLLKYIYQIRKDASNDTDDFIESSSCIFDSILPLKTFQCEDDHLDEKVSTIPGTRTDVINLNQLFDTYLQTHHARETATCPIKRQLYDQCLDALIRQLTLNCVDRELLFYRIRNELLMIINSLQNVHENAISYCIRIVLLYKKRQHQIKSHLIEMTKENAILKLKIKVLENDIEDQLQRIREIIDSFDKCHNEEIKKLNRIIHQQKMLIEALKRKTN